METKMGLMILGFIVLLIGFFGAGTNSPLNKIKGLLKLGGIVVIIVGFLMSAVKQIDAGHIGVQILFGKVERNVLTEGLNVINPLYEVKPMTLQTQNYTMSASYQEGQVQGDDAIRVLSKDGLEIIIDMTILYRIIPSKAPEIYREIGLDYETKVIRPTVRTRIREIAVFYNATDLYTQQRENFETRIRQLIEKDFHERGLILENLLVRKVKLTKSVEESIERKITAVQDAQRMEFVLQKERQEAERKRVEAQGTADAQRIVSAALTDKILQWESIKVQKELVNSPNAKIIMMGDSKKSPGFMIGDK
jgi:regulator of protease activity HflC (stomatin/prohibitin superfamily)